MAPSTNNAAAGVMIIPDADDFMKVMAALQEEYNAQHGHNGDDEDEA